MVDGASRPLFEASATQAKRRLRITTGLIVALVAAGLALSPSGGSSTVSAATTSSTIYGPVFPLAAFPVQGKCSYTDTYGAPRSGGRFHEGVDLIAKTGQYVYAASDGTLTKKYLDAPGSLSGNGWRLTAADGTYFFYAHFSAFADGLSVGSKVVAGQIIGYVGMTGDAGIPHLHFEIHPGGGASINPTPSVHAIDACNVTAVPPVATNPTDPSQTNVPGSSNPSSTNAPTTTAPPAPPAESTNGKWQFIDPIVVYNGASLTSLAPGVVKHIKIAGVAGISPTTSGVLVRVSSTVKAAGSVLVHPCTGNPPVATSLFVEPGPMAIGTAVVDVTNGEICVSSNTSASVKVTVVGQQAATGVGVAPIVTTRVLDTRNSGKLAANQTITISPSTLGDVTGVKAVTVAFTIISPSAAGTLSVGPCGGAPLKAPFGKTAIWAFSSVLQISATGLCVSSTTAMQLVVDVSSVWLNDAPIIMPTNTVRIYDSRDLGHPVGLDPVPVAIDFEGAPAGITTVAISLTVLGGPEGGSVFAWPCEKPMPASVVGVVAPNKRGSFTVIAAVSDGKLCLASNHPLHFIVDVDGTD